MTTPKKMTQTINDIGNKGINVLSLFDGISCARVALEKAGKNVVKYYASEIEKKSILIAQKNYPDTIQVGDVIQLQHIDWEDTWIDLLVAGSPCQGFSIAGNQLNFDHPQSKLFFEFVRILEEIKAKNPNVKFLLENVKMKKEYQDVISKILGVQPIEVNSALVSAQNRVRLYWTNIEGFVMPKDKDIVLLDILQHNVEDKYYHSEAAINYMNRVVNGGRNHWDFAHHSDTNKAKSACITANFKKGVPYNVLIQRSKVNQINPYSGCSTNQPKMQHRIFSAHGKSTALTTFSGRTAIYPDKDDLIRKLTPIECERLQTLPDNYTFGAPDTKRYEAIGNGWNVDTVVEFFKHL